MDVVHYQKHLGNPVAGWILAGNKKMKKFNLGGVQWNYISPKAKRALMEMAQGHHTIRPESHLINKRTKVYDQEYNNMVWYISP